MNKHDLSILGVHKSDTIYLVIKIAVHDYKV